MNTLFLIGILSLFVHAKAYRFDYEWNNEAEGWLKYHAVPAIWDEARLRCHAEGAVLASPLSSQLKFAIISFAKNRRNASPCIFTGVHATFSKGDYSSIEGVPLLRLSITWAPGEPDNYENSESCLAMTIDSEGVMADRRCSDVLPYVCYKRYTNLTFTNCGTYDPDYILEPKTGSCYKFHEQGRIWSEAYMTCIAEGGYLAVINNNVEAEAIKEIISKHPEQNIFSPNRATLLVGFHDWGRRGASFMTIHGENLEANYQNWIGGEPNNATNERTGDLGQYCGSISRSGQFDDFWANVPAAFLCEKSPNSLFSY